MKAKEKMLLKRFLVDTQPYFIHRICTLCVNSQVCLKRIEKDVYFL